jgi:hypothetical protein
MPEIASPNPNTNRDGTIAVGFVLIGLAQALRLLLALVALQQGH